MIKRNPRIIKRNFEIWKSINGFPGYEISNMGKVKSLEKYTKHWAGGLRLLKERILKGSLSSSGYFQVDLPLENAGRNRTIHLIVIEHFGDPKPSPKHECNHKDGDKQNNWWTNLEWMTRKANIKHAYDLGLAIGNSGEKNGYSTLTEKEVKRVRKMYITGKYTQTKLAKIFKVGQFCIWSIVHNKTWRTI